MSNQYTKSLDWHKKVFLAIQAGNSIDLICQNFRCNKKTITKSLNDHKEMFTIATKGTISLGRKSEPYFSESEMLNGFSVSVHELSKSELAYLESL